MLGRDHDISGSPAASDLQPLVGVKINWIELLVEMIVDGIFDMPAGSPVISRGLDPLRDQLISVPAKLEGSQ